MRGSLLLSDIQRSLSKGPSEGSRVQRSACNVSASRKVFQGRTLCKVCVAGNAKKWKVARIVKNWKGGLFLQSVFHLPQSLPPIPVLAIKSREFLLRSPSKRTPSLVCNDDSNGTKRGMPDPSKEEFWAPSYMECYKAGR